MSGCDISRIVIVASSHFVGVVGALSQCPTVMLSFARRSYTSFRSQVSKVATAAPSAKVKWIGRWTRWSMTNKNRDKMYLHQESFGIELAELCIAFPCEDCSRVRVLLFEYQAHQIF